MRKFPFALSSASPKCSDLFFTINPTYFTSMLASGDLQEKYSIQIPGSDIQTTIQTLMNQLKFSVVEQIGESASLYSTSIQQHHICLLVKKVNNGISIDGKSNNGTILSNVLEEVKLVLK